MWVYLADRDLAPDDLPPALAAAESALPARALQRRAKVLAPGARVVDARDLPLAPRYLAAIAGTGARERHQSRWLNAVSVDATSAQIAELSRLPFVTRIELVVKSRRALPPAGADEQTAAESRDDASWRLNYGGSLAGLEQINVPPVHEAGNFGQGVVIGLLDSGFKTTHEALAGVPVVARHDFVDNDEEVANEAGDLYFQHDHGTKTLSTLMGRHEGRLIGPACGASVILAKTEDAAGVSDRGGPVGGGAGVGRGARRRHRLEQPRLRRLVYVRRPGRQYRRDHNRRRPRRGRGLVVVNAAGNERNTAFAHIVVPADGDSVIAVGAVTLAGSVASFSSPGPTFDGRIKPDVAAQGVANHVGLAAR